MSSNDLWAKFAPKEGTWRCSTCLVENDPSKLKCVCCEADAPAAKGAAAPAPAPAPAAAAGAAAPPSFADVWKKFNNFEEGAWTCSTCLVVNKPGAPQCVACEAPNPKAGAAPAAAAPAPAPAAGGFVFGASAAPAAAAPAAAGFNFGIPAPAPAAAAGGFNFGFGAAPAEASKPAAGGFVFGAAAPAAAAPAAAPSFNFGFGAAPAAAAPAAPAQPERKDKFGAHDLFAGGAEDATVPTVPKGCSAPSAAGLAPLALVDKAPAAASAHVYSVGSGECEQLGHGGDYPSLAKPRLVRALFKVPVVRIAVGGLHTLALTATGKVWSWGCNDDQALGRPGGMESVPGLVRGPLDGVRVTIIGAGDSHSCAVDEAGGVYAWGTYKGADGYLGFDAHTQKQATPRPMTAVAAYGKAVQLSCAADHTGVTTDEGIAVVWGYGGQGQLGRNPTERDLRGNRTAGISLTPYPIHIMRKRGEAAPADDAAAGSKRKRASTASVHRKAGEYEVAAVHCAGYSTFVAVKDGAGGRVYACGLNTYGQLGLGDTENRTTPAEVEGLRGKGVLQIVGGSQHTLALAGDGSVYGFGRADSGQLGLRPRDAPAGAASFTLPVAASAFVPVRLPPAAFGGMAVAAISASSCTSAAVTVDGKAYAWGFGESGQLANQDGGDEKLPHLINGEEGPACAGEMKGVAATGIGMGGQHLVVLGSGGAKAAALAADKSEAVVQATKVVEDPVEDEEGEEGSGGDDDGDDEEGGSEGSGGDDDDDDEDDDEEEAEPAAKKARRA